MLASTWDWPVVPWHRQNFDQYPNGYGSKGVPTDPWNRSSWPILSMTPSNFGLNSGRTIAILICGYSQSLDPSWSVLWGSIFLHKLENPIHVLFSINVSVYTHPIPSHPDPYLDALPPCLCGPARCRRWWASPPAPSGRPSRRPPAGGRKVAMFGRDDFFGAKKNVPSVLTSWKNWVTIW
jgi:hypothetical protein